MKKHLLLAVVLLLSAITFGQKKEIKKADKQVKSGNYAEAMTLLNQAEGLLSNADNALKTQFYVVKATALMESAGADFSKLKSAAEALNKAKELGSGKNSETVDEGIENLRGKLERSATTDYKAELYKNAAEKFEMAYAISPNDTIFLFNAALSSKIGKDYESANANYQTLADIGYTGVQKEFIATNKETGKVETFTTKTNRDLYIKAGTHSTPSERTSDSKREIVMLSLAQISSELGDDEKAMKIINDVRKESPDDMTLIQVEADMAYKLGNIERYNELMQEMIKLSPDNPDLYNNLGVASARLGLKEKAIEYYKKAIELKPDNAGSMINIAVLILSDEGEINEEMNSLGTSNADYARYDELKAVKQDLYKEAMPYLETALESRTDNIEIVRTLMGIYGQLGEDAKFKAMKVRLQEMEGGQ